MVILIKVLKTKCLYGIIYLHLYGAVVSPVSFRKFTVQHSQIKNIILVSVDPASSETTSVALSQYLDLSIKVITLHTGRYGVDNF
jgi:hypothetical protein